MEYITYQLILLQDVGNQIEYPATFMSYIAGYALVALPERSAPKTCRVSLSPIVNFKQDGPGTSLIYLKSLRFLIICSLIDDAFFTATSSSVDPGVFCV